MAVDLSAISTLGRILAATTTADSVTLDPNRAYDFHHTGLSPTAGTTAVHDVILGINAAPSAYDKAAATNKLILKANTVITIPRKATSVFFAVVSGGDACQLNVVPDDWDGGAH